MKMYPAVLAVGLFCLAAAFTRQALAAKPPPARSASIVPSLASANAHPVHAHAASRISFVNDVVPALTRAGCNQGACHGAAQGKNGFRLSLRGFAPERDYDSIMRQAGGRRVCISDPLRSLLLQKPLMQVAHRGGMALHPDTPEYTVLTQWLRQGANGPDAHDAALVGLQVTPNDNSVAPRASLHLKVMARFANGATRDVTYWTRYGTNDETVATAAPGGGVQMCGYGETAITIAYQDRVAMARVRVPYPNAVTAPAASAASKASTARLAAAFDARARPDTTLINRTPTDTVFSDNAYIDRLVDAKLNVLHLGAAAQTDDHEFCRRLYLDLTGTLPTWEQAQAFALDANPDKRARLVDELMLRPEFVDFWTYKWGDLLRVNRGSLKDKGMWAFYAWVHDSVQANKPWDQMTREILTATGNTFMDGPANYFRTALKPEELAENVSQGFLGIRVQCAKCHNHPLEKWTQNEYYGMANLFARVRQKVNLDIWVNDEMTVGNLPSGDIIQPRLGHAVAPQPLGGTALALDAREDRRAFLARWMTSPDNKQFSRAFVNRVWAHFLGRGLVEPVDDLRETNPPTNPALMDALATDFVRHRFDIRHLIRQIVLSQAYGRSSRITPRNKQDDRYYSRYLVKRLTAEQLLDALSQVTGQPEAFPGMPPGYRALQLPDTRVKSEFMDSYGRPARQITCECERAQEPSMAQALLFINSDVVNKKVTADGGLADTLVKSGRTDAQILDTLYQSVLTRMPTPYERAADLAAIRRASLPQMPLIVQTRVQTIAATPVPVKPAANVPASGMTAASPPVAAPHASADAVLLARRRAFEDMLWVLVNSKEFLFNH